MQTIHKPHKNHTQTVCKAEHTYDHSTQAALSRTYLAHHELESDFIITDIILTQAAHLPSRD